MRLEFNRGGVEGGDGNGGKFGGEAETRIGRSDDGNLAAVCAENVAGNGKAQSAMVRAGVEERVEKTRKISG